MKRNAVAITVLSALLLLAPATSKGSSPVALLEPQSITDVEDHLFVDYDPTPNDQINIIVRWQDDKSHAGNAISQAVSYDPSAFTGFTPSSPRNTWQRGEFDDAVNGSPVYQLQGTTGGILMNSWFTTYQNVVGGGANTTYEYKFSSPPAVWTTPNSKLWVQGDLKIPWFANWDNNSNDNWPVGQVSYFIYLKDTSTDQTFCYVINAFDNRPTVPDEAIMHDTFTYFASTYFGAKDYVTPNPYSGSWTYSTWNQYVFYRAEIQPNDLVSALTDANTLYGAGLSTNPADYVLTSVGILQETFREDGDQISLGISFRDFGVYVDN